MKGRMIWTEGTEAFGFRVTAVKESRELKGRAVYMEHRKTGARLFWLDNGAENKNFSIAFRTIPEDSIGVFHILEHSVLSGSEKYPVREPFVELLKSSMSTFLNAMTFPDQTMYPVSSRNSRDLLNLTEVYLDAVFAPTCIRDEKIFRQEGWHIDLDEEGNPVYQGVVYNEMKGSMSDTGTVIDRQLMRQLFPDNGYGFNSGGDPEEIPNLTWEEFIRQYRRFYHPSNALVYLDGAVPLEELLERIGAYFDRYEKRTDLPDFRAQQPVGSECTIRYELAQDEAEENRGYWSMARIVGSWQDRAENQARAIISDVLTGSNEAPLKRLALERNLCQDLSLCVDDTGYQTWISVHADNVTDGREGEIDALLKEYGEVIRREGLERKAVEASLNRAIYILREEDEPQGINRCIRAMGSWLYGGDPLEMLETEEPVRRMREMLEDGTMDRLAADFLLNRENAAILHTLPSHTLGEEKRAAEAERLRQVTAAWTPEDWAARERMSRLLEEWHNTPDSPEALATLPMLTRADADVTPQWTDTEESRLDGARILRHRLNCNGVVHLRAYIALTDWTLEELTRGRLFASLLGRLSTAQHDARSLQLETKSYIGELGFGVTILSRKDQTETCIPCLVASASALEENADRAQELLAEILTSTRLDETDRILEIVMQTEMGLRQRMASAGHTVGMKKVLSFFSAEGAARNAIEGEDAVRYVHGFAREPERELPHLRTIGKKMMEESLCRRRMTVSVTADGDFSPEKLIRAFPEGTEVPEVARYALKAPEHIGYRIPAQIGFAIRGYRLDLCGGEFNGAMYLAAAILSLGYLWNQVRVQGGAYGAGLTVDRAGNIYTCSYRDPTPGRTLKADLGLADYLRDFVEKGDELDKYIISSLNDLNPLLSARSKGGIADVRYLMGYTKEQAEKIRKQVLYVTPEELMASCDWLEVFAREGTTCVVGHQQALDACPDRLITDL